MSSGNRKLSRYTDGHGVAPDHAAPDPNPGREPAGVDPDDDPVDVEDEPEVDDTECVECGSPSVEFDDPADALDAPEMPSDPHCRKCLLDQL